MMKNLLFVAALIVGPSFASATTLIGISGAPGEAKVDKSTSTDLTGVGLFVNEPLVVTDDGFKPRSYLSPFGRNDNDTDYFVVGDASKPDYQTTANSDTPAALSLDNLSQSISFYWGSPDNDNFVTLMRGNTLIASYSGADLRALLRGNAFAMITADNETEYFDSVLFGTYNPAGRAQAFEFAGIEAVPAPVVVPLPAGLPMLLTALGAMGIIARRKGKV